jgi:hypothetical protein
VRLMPGDSARGRDGRLCYRREMTGGRIVCGCYVTRVTSPRLDHGRESRNAATNSRSHGSIGNPETCIVYVDQTMIAGQQIGAVERARRGNRIERVGIVVCIAQGMRIRRVPTVRQCC